MRAAQTTKVACPATASAILAARTQKSDFLAPGGGVVDVCGGKPCHTDAYTP
jgi:hypothetical protein